MKSSHGNFHIVDIMETEEPEIVTVSVESPQSSSDQKEPCSINYAGMEIDELRTLLAELLEQEKLAKSCLGVRLSYHISWISSFFLSYCCTIHLVIFFRNLDA